MNSSNSDTSCPVCSSRNATDLIDIPSVPVYCNVFCSSSDEALNAPKGQIALKFCNDCGHIFNATFDPERMDYDVEYDNSLHFSPRFNEYAHELATRLVADYGLYNKQVIELGCGKGDFLNLLCQLGDNKAYGFDRSYDLENAPTSGGVERVTFVQDFYSEAYAELPADFVCCRHVLEHVEDPTDFLTNLRRWLEVKNRPVLYFEVPNGLFTLESLGIWDLIYEHCSYFTEQSLVRAFERAGFEVLKTGTSFAGQYLYVEARIAEQAQTGDFSVGRSMTELRALASEFETSYRQTVAAWRDKLSVASDGRSVVWGAGSKGVTFLNVMQGAANIEHVVDLNPHKQGRFVPGTGQQVLPPEALSDYQPDSVIVMNEVYLDEITRTVESMGLSATVLAV